MRVGPPGPARTRLPGNALRRGTIELETGSLPECITTGPGDTLFARARKDGAVRQYSTTTGGLLRTVVAPRDGEVAGTSTS